MHLCINAAHVYENKLKWADNCSKWPAAVLLTYNSTSQTTCQQIKMTILQYYCNLGKGVDIKKCSVEIRTANTVWRKEKLESVGVAQ